MRIKMKWKSVISFALTIPFLASNFLFNSSYHVSAEGITLPKNVFLSKVDLNKLGTGTSEITEKIVIGQLPQAVQYDDGKTSENDLTLSAGSEVEWYVVGTDKKGTDDEPSNMVLYSVKPIYAEDEDFNDFNLPSSSYSVNYSQVEDRGIDYSPNSPPTNVDAAHYGASKVRKILKNIFPNMFKMGQQNLIQQSKIKTSDAHWSNPMIYSVEDELYVVSATNNPANVTGLAGNDILYAGENNDLLIGPNYLGPKVWLRTAFASSQVYQSTPEIVEGSAYVSSGTPAISAAMKVNLGSVEFISKALGVSSSTPNMQSFKEIDIDTGMRMRINGGKGDVYKIGNIVNYSNVPADSKLVVVAHDETKSYEFSETISESGSVDLSNKGLPEKSSYEAWIEQMGSGDNEGLILSTALAESLNAFDEMSNGVRVTADAGVFPEGADLRVDAVQDGEQGYKIISENISNTEEIEHFTTYNVAVYDSSNNLVDKFSSAYVWLPISDKMDLNNVSKYFLTYDNSQISNGEIKEYNGVKYYVFKTSSFTPYVAIDGFNKNSFPLTGDIDTTLIEYILLISILILVGLFAKKKKLISNN